MPLVKILAGIRRCGKSTILEMLQDDLIKSGVLSDHILSMRYTSEDFDDGMTDKEMYNGIKEKMTDDGRYYLLLDEVQEITGWEKAVNSLLEIKDHYPKYVVTLDELAAGNINGVKIVYLADFLLSEDY